MVGMRAAAADVESALENIMWMVCCTMFVPTLLPKKRQDRESELPEEVIMVIEYNVELSAYVVRGAKIGGSRRKFAAFPQLLSFRVSRALTPTGREKSLPYVDRQSDKSTR